VAKKKTSSSTANKSAARTSRDPSAQTDGRKTAGARPQSANEQAAAASADRKRALSQDEIGAVAGEIWHVLSERGGQNLTSLKKSVNAPGDLVLAATGWLAREGKLEFDTSGRAVKVSLR
jgi:hypothetical protein